MECASKVHGFHQGLALSLGIDTTLGKVQNDPWISVVLGDDVYGGEQEVGNMVNRLQGVMKICPSWIY